MPSSDLRRTRVRSGHFRSKGTRNGTGLEHRDGIDLPSPRLFRKAEGPGQPATTKLRIPTGNKISKHHRADARRSPVRSRAHNARRAPSVSWGVLQSSASPKVGTGLNSSGTGALTPAL